MEAEVMERFRQIYTMLEDEESKDIYLNRLNYLISGDFRYMRNIIDRYVPVPEIDAAVFPKDKPIILYGAGTAGIYFSSHFDGDPRLVGFCDRDKSKQENGVAGYKVISPEELLREKDITIVICTLTYFDEVKSFLLENGVEEERIYNYEMLLSENDLYFKQDFMTLEDEEVFVDAGAYNLDTSRKLGKYCSRIKKVYAFEPDPDNYGQCVRNKKWFEPGMVEVFPYGTWSSRKTLCFHAKGNEGSQIADSGDVGVEVISIDEVVDTSLKVTLIKMDVEGSELESLKGAKETILRDKPKLVICIYHKPEDMLTLPWYIKSLVPEYKLYLRHNSNRQDGTVLYAMP